jgi:hypothetical protein
MELGENAEAACPFLASLKQTCILRFALHFALQKVWIFSASRPMSASVGAGHRSPIQTFGIWEHHELKYSPRRKLKAWTNPAPIAW